MALHWYDDNFFGASEKVAAMQRQDAAAKAAALLRENTSDEERTEAGLDQFAPLVVRGGVSGYTYKVQVVDSPAGISLVDEFDRLICGFCVYTVNYSHHPVHDEVLAMVLHIKYAEIEFLETAIPHVRRGMEKFYEAVVNKAGAHPSFMRHVLAGPIRF